MKLSRATCFLIAVILIIPAAAFADSSALILRGVAGSPEHEEKFEKWTALTAKSLVDKFGFSADHVIVLSGQKTAQAEIMPTMRKAGRKSSVVNVGLALKRLVTSTSRAPTATPQETETCCSTLTIEVAELMRCGGTSA